MDKKTLRSAPGVVRILFITLTASYLFISAGITYAQRTAGVDVMLVLDKSGSMNQSVPGLSMTKWGVLQESVQAFLEAYRMWKVDADRIGVTYFDHTRSDFPPGGMIAFNAPMNPLPLTGTGSIKNDIMGRTPGGSTCLGGGILAGYFAFDGAHPNRNMIIFTDGIQNMEPTVSQAIATDMVINDYNVRPDGIGFPSPPLDLKNPSLPFRTYTIAIGDNAVTALLQDIARAPVNTAYDGQSYPLNSMIILPMELSMIFNQTFVDNLATFSPQLMDIRRITGNSTTVFAVNPSADKLLIHIVGEPANLREAQLRIEKDGRDFSSLISTGGLTYKSFFLDSLLSRRYNVQLGGEWKVSVSGNTGKFQVSGMVNDEKFGVSASIGHTLYSPGDTVSLEALLEYSGGPVVDADVSVLVGKPGTDTNDLFAAAGTVSPSGNFPGEEANDPGQSKYEALIAFDSAFVASLQPVIDTINLIHDADGRYVGQFADTQESGIYRFVFRMTGSNATTGNYERFVMRSAVIDFGEPDVSGTTFQIVKKEKLAYLQILPRNKFGHLLGPNRLNQIHVSIDGKSISLTDKLDGQYEVQLPARSFFNPDPDVKVNIKQASFYEGRLSEIEGSDLGFWGKYRLWILLLFLLVALLLLLLRRRTAP